MCVRVCTVCACTLSVFTLYLSSVCACFHVCTCTCCVHMQIDADSNKRFFLLLCSPAFNLNIAHALCAFMYLILFTCFIECIIMMSFFYYHSFVLL